MAGRTGASAKIARSLAGHPILGGSWGTATVGRHLASTGDPSAAQIKAGPPVRDGVHTEIHETEEGPTFTYRIDHQALMQWGQIHWGKTLLFTDQATWSTVDMITAYRNAWPGESTIRDCKQAAWLHGQPQFHWTDQKIRVHGFICVLAVTLAHLLRREYVRAGIDLSLPTLLKELTAIQEVLWVYPPQTKMAPQQLPGHWAIRLPAFP